MIEEQAREQPIEGNSTKSPKLFLLDNSVVGTMKIDPRPYKAVAKNVGDIARAKYAVAGLLYMLRREQSVRNLLMTSIIVMVLVFWLRLELERGLLIFLALGLVWATESMNSAVEAVVDLVTHEIHPMAKVAKDVAAAGTLAATFTATVVTLILLVPPLLDKLGLM